MMKEGMAGLGLSPEDTATVFRTLAEANDARDAALARVAKLEGALRRLVANLPPFLLDEAREIWGNTNVNIVEMAREEAYAALDAGVALTRSAGNGGICREAGRSAPAPEWRTGPPPEGETVLAWLAGEDAPRVTYQRGGWTHGGGAHWRPDDRWMHLPPKPTDGARP